VVVVNVIVVKEIKMKLEYKDKYGYPVERVIGRPILNFFRLLLLTRSISKRRINNE